MRKNRIIILGAGLAGLSAAWHLQKKGINCRIFEKESQVGGLCRSKKINGFIFDCDGHLLHFKHTYTLNLVKNLLNGNLIEHKRDSRVYFKKNLIRYPFQHNLYGLPEPVIKECLLGFIKARVKNKSRINNNLNFLQWINQTFGAGIASHFMIPYNRKFWTIALDRLTCDWVDGFINTPSLMQIVEGAIKESSNQIGYNARFWYPQKGGISSLPMAMGSRIKNIRTNCQIKEIILKRKEIVMVSGERERFDSLIYTIPLPEAASLIKDIPIDIRLGFNKLRWNSIFNLNLGYSQNTAESRHWVYFPGKDVCFFRVGFFHNFSPHLAPSGKFSLYAEVSYSENKAVDKHNLILKIKDGLRKSGVIGENTKFSAQDINDIKYAYPIYDANYGSACKAVRQFLKSNNIYTCGRFGSWRYMSMEDAILDGMQIADKIHGKT